MPSRESSLQPCTFVKLDMRNLQQDKGKEHFGTRRSEMSFVVVLMAF